MAKQTVGYLPQYMMIQADKGISITILEEAHGLKHCGEKLNGEKSVTLVVSSSTCNDRKFCARMFSV